MNQGYNGIVDRYPLYSSTESSINLAKYEAGMTGLNV